MLDRRTLLRDFAGGLAAAPLAAVLASPVLARKAADGLETVTIDIPGGGPVSASLALPARTPAPCVLLIHEWWGLNDQIKAVAAEFARLGFVGLAADLYDGEVAESPDSARSLMRGVDPERAAQTLVAWIGFLGAHAAGNGKVGTVGWCFGGGWSLSASIASPVDATVVYYGRVNRKAEDLAALKGPVLGHFATADKWITRKMVEDFESEMKRAGKPATIHWYRADHAFANPTGARYDRDDAALAWERTIAFLERSLRG